MIQRSDITGLLLAGGRGSRMGGVDKGLQPHAGTTLASHALDRLRPQVGRLIINANRNIERYAAMGAPVWPDAVADFAGPLAGLQAGLAHCETPYLVTVPCDSPLFPDDLVERLASAIEAEGAELAIAVTVEDGREQTHPVFCFLSTHLRESLERFLAEGGRKVDRWTSSHRCVKVLFEDSHAFVNANSLEELAQLQTTADGNDAVRRS